MEIKAQEQVEFELDSNDILVIRNLADQLANEMKVEIKNSIQRMANEHEKILDDLNSELSFAEQKMATELGKIDDALGGYKEITDENGVVKKKIRMGGTLKEAQQAVKDAERDFNNAMREANVLEKKSHAYEIEKEKLDLMDVSKNISRVEYNLQKEKVDSMKKFYDDHENAMKKVDECYRKLQDAENELSRQEDIVESFKHVGEEHLELDRDTAEKTNDNLGHYISTHWGAKVSRLKKIIGMISNLTMKGYDNPEIIQKFQNAFGQKTADIIFNGFIKTIKTVTNQMYFTGFEFSDYDKTEFIDEALHEMPRDMPKGYNPFFAMLGNENYVTEITDPDGQQIKILDLGKVSPEDIAANYSAFVIKHFDTACRYALKKFKEKRDFVVPDWEEGNNDEDDEGFSKSDRSRMNTSDEDEYSSLPGSSSNAYNPNKVDQQTQDFWKEMSAYMLLHIDDMAQDATIAMRDYLPKKAYFLMIPEQKAIQEITNVYRKLIETADDELSNGRPISRKLKNILLYALGGSGNYDELEIEFNAIYAAFELYMYKFMIESEEANRDDANGWRSKRNDRVIERLRQKMNEAQMKLNDPELADYAFNACKSLNDSRMEDRINFLLSDHKTTDGSGKYNNFIIDPHPQRG